MEVVCAETSICTCCPLSLPGNLAADVAAVSCLWSGSLSCPPTAVESNCIRSPICASGKFGSAAVSTPLLPLEFQASRQRAQDQNGPAALNYLGWQSGRRGRQQMSGQPASAHLAAKPATPRTCRPHQSPRSPAAAHWKPARPRGRFDKARTDLSLRIKDFRARRAQPGSPAASAPQHSFGSKSARKDSLPHLRDSLATSVLWPRVCLLDWALGRQNLRETVPT